MDALHDAFQQVSDSMSELVGGFYSQAALGDINTFALTPYIFWMIIACIIMIAVFFTYKNRMSKQMEKGDLVPHGFFMNGVEYLVDFVKNDVCKGNLGDTWKKHFPFLATLFFFVMFGNYVGMLPTWKPGTGSTGITGAIALYSFIYFIVAGVKAKGAGRYLKEIIPQGLPVAVQPLIYLIEIFSTFLRLITLAVRLFCNMFAGHVVMGVFATMCTIFLNPLLSGIISGATIGTGAMSLLWMILLILIYAVELMIAFIQAYIFTLLSAVYISTAETSE